LEAWRAVVQNARHRYPQAEIYLMRKILSSLFSGFRPVEIVLFLGVLILGLFLRFTDLTDPPLDFHPMRQLRGAIIARSMYYQMLHQADPVLAQKAVEATYTIEPQEPPVLERIVALTYLVTGEKLWVARVYSILFWVIAGLGFFTLARWMTSTSGGLATWAYFLLLPFGVVASRTFQPDPFMVMWISLTLLAAYRWGETGSWKWALATGLLAGWAMFVKITAVYYLAPALVVIVLTRFGLKKALRSPWVWLAALLAVAIPAVYYFGIIGNNSTGWFSGWALSFTKMLVKPRFYVTWLKYLDYLMDLTMLGLALLGLVFVPKNKDRLLLLGLWAGYVLFGLSFPYPIQTHEYYSIMLIPVAGMSLAGLGKVVFAALGKQPPLWQWLAVPVLLLAVAYPAWLTYTGFIGTNYRNEPAAWQKMGETLPSGEYIDLTHDYGMRIAYYGWRMVRFWPANNDFAMLAQRNKGYKENFEKLFVQKTSGMDYFLVTLKGELEAQPELKARLYDNYPYTQGNGYILFDLRHPLH
jgi:4-amino-4-deoxy-L-arabinose transferase-like glycosyltransferase